MSKDYQEVYSNPQRVPMTNYTRTMFLDTLSKLRPNSNVQELVAAGSVDLTKPTCVLSSSGGGPYVVTLPDGTDVNERAEVIFTGTGGSFELHGTFYEWSKVVFDVNGRSAVFFWTGTAWMFVSGNANPQ